MSIATILDAFTLSDEKIARRVFAVGAERHAGLSTADLVTLATDAAEDAGLTLEGFSTATVNNAFTSYNLFISTGLKAPNPDAKSLDKGKADVARLIEACRVKHGAKIVKAAIKETVEPFSDDITVEARTTAIAHMLDALLSVPKAEKEDNPRTPEQRFMSALNAAQNLLDQIELDGDQAEEAMSILNNIMDAIS